MEFPIERRCRAGNSGSFIQVRKNRSLKLRRLGGTSGFKIFREENIVISSHTDRFSGV
jgi:hypothetical protein